MRIPNIRSLQISEAIQRQIEVQRKLHEQLEVYDPENPESFKMSMYPNILNDFIDLVPTILW